MPSRQSSSATYGAARADLIASLAGSLGADRAVKPPPCSFHSLRITPCRPPQ
jgi:hypothetical protein